MKTKNTNIWQFLLIFTLLFTLSACGNEGYVEGPELGGYASPTDGYASPTDGYLNGKFSSAGGRYTNRFEVSGLVPDEVDVDFILSVESGTLKVSITTPDENHISDTATPEHSIHLTSRSIIKTDATVYYIPIIFETIGENEVMGIEYTLSYDVP